MRLSELHKIILRDATDRMLFAFVRAAVRFDKDTTIINAVREFYAEFGVDDYCEETSVREYYRMLNQYIGGTIDAGHLKKK